MSGWKDWAIGEVVTESEFQSFVQDQVVQRYADATERDNTLGANVAEGMVCYLKDVNETQVYDGTDWVQVGEGDITGVTAGTALTGGGTSGDVTLDVDIKALATAHAGNALNANGQLLDVDESALTIAQSQVTNLTSNLADKADASDFTGGTEGFTAVSNGSAGLSYQPISHNYIINGAFDIWQRGDAVSQTSNQYTSDRWYVRDFGQTWSVTEQDSGLTGFEKCARVQRDSGDTAAASLFFGQPIETANAIQLAGQDVVLSFYARKGSNYSASSDELIATLRTGTADNENLLLGGTGVSTIANEVVTLTSSWQKFTVTATAGATTKSFAAFFNSVSTGTAGSDDYYEITGVQLEAGSIATPFKRNANSIAGEKLACMRYYQRYSGTNRHMAISYCATTSQTRQTFNLPVPLRQLNSFDSDELLTFYNGFTAVSPDGESPPSATLSDDGVVAEIRFIAGTSPFTVGEAALLNFSSQGGYMEFEGELQ